jgi:acetylornithine deacetylase/succinyl-diaminopimelate desuccinylase-like protein
MPNHLVNSDDHIHPVELLRNLIRFDTTNPPGNEAACISYIKEVLDKAGIDSIVLESQPNRANLIARIKGRDIAPPFLLYGHVDVVTTEGQQWTHQPFEAKIVDGTIWGRGALDMKGGVAMMMAAFIKANTADQKPAGDIVLAIVADEEAGGDHGVRFLVDSHPELFEGIQYAIGEVGGSTLNLGGRRFYPIQIAEKQLCWMRASISGPGGHGAQPMRAGTMARLGRFLTDLDENRLPVHVTSVTKSMIELMASQLSPSSDIDIAGLLDLDRSDSVLDQLKEVGRFFEPLLRNTVNATIVEGGSKVNVIPSSVSVDIDGRLLPGYGPQDMVSELQQIVGNEVEFEIIRHEPTPSKPDMGLYDMLADIIMEADPGSVPVPFLLAGVTDARIFARLGIQTYGFMPMKLPEDFNRIGLVHAADERVPVEAIEFGTEAIYQAIQRYPA